MPPGINNRPGGNFGMFPNGPRMGTQPNFRGPGGFPFQNRPPMQNQRMQQQGGGGLLSKLLGKSKQQSPSPVSFFSRPQAQPVVSGGFIAGLKNPGTITTMLANTQKMLTAAERLGPMVQEYGPLIKNLPAMWKIYRSMKDSEDSTGAKNEINEEEKEDSVVSENDEKIAIAGEEKQLEGKNEQKNGKIHEQKGSSVPKLYI
ncbi:hypothetical protein ELQ35_12675 [Peribacillus cavernae]|uniref:YqfQ-like protein n=1 Tax=Peribacillus cavernae TaxID=1674310 RepID=A0A433HK16_9BACI|nr:VrrA/YqfQ family protein [Peribacillus cavernae]MDQ0218283.1 hypothetical protein [Peribacillus cavernae]RUQ28432.1 hypothetical protein ELQ35_12675 [Peribacillus cavernae]